MIAVCHRAVKCNAFFCQQERKALLLPKSLALISASGNSRNRSDSGNLCRFGENRAKILLISRSASGRNIAASKFLTFNYPNIAA